MPTNKKNTKPQMNCQTRDAAAWMLISCQPSTLHKNQSNRERSKNWLKFREYSTTAKRRVNAEFGGVQRLKKHGITNQILILPKCLINTTKQIQQPHSFYELASLNP
jgi:hypothetical protein